MPTDQEQPVYMNTAKQRQNTASDGGRSNGLGVRVGVRVSRVRFSGAQEGLGARVRAFTHCHCHCYAVFCGI